MRHVPSRWLILGLLPWVLVAGEASGPQIRVAIGDGAARAQAATSDDRAITAAMASLLTIMPGFQVSPERLAVLHAAIDPDHQAELAALAAGAGLPVESVAAANLGLETLCTVIVQTDPDGSLRIGRNMDFAPRRLLGPSTRISLDRRPDRLAIVRVGWPGYVGCITGFNERGVMAAVLQNFGSVPGRTGVPLAFRVREVLETASSASAAVAAFAERPVASDHFVLWADAGWAAVSWWNADGVRSVPLGDGRLLWSNEAPDADGRQRGERPAAMSAALAAGPLHETDLRRCLLSVALPELNAQAMTWRPAERRLHVALALNRQAGESPWWSVDLAAAFAGAATAAWAPTR
jgi:hypothetical protein